MRNLHVWTAVLAALVGATGTALAQERQITGTVTRATDGQPIAEAAISVAGGGPRAAARSNAQGRYSVTVGPGETKLTIPLRKIAATEDEGLQKIGAYYGRYRAAVENQQHRAAS